MPTATFQYRDPASGLILNRTETVSFEMSRDQVLNSVTAILRCTRGSGSGSDNDCIIDVTDKLNLVLYGNGMLAPPGMYMTPLTAQEVGLSPANTTLSVENSGAPTDALPRGLNAAIGDPIAIIDKAKADGTPSTINYRLVATVPGATSITINSTLDNTFNKGAMILNLRYGTIPRFLTGRGINKRDGARSYLEAPDFSQPAVVWQASPAGFSVTFVADSTSILPQTFYRIYVRSSADDKFNVEPHWVPDLEVANPTTAQLVTTYDGGTAAGGGTIAPASTYQIHFTRANYTGSFSAPQLLKTISTSRLSQIAA